MTRDTDWTAASSAHRRSIEQFLEHARRVPPTEWEAPVSPGKWSPAQVAEHLRLTYEVIGREAAGGAAIRIRTSWWVRMILRLRYLPAILARGEIPGGAIAPRELRPGDGPFDRESLLAALQATAASTEAAITGAGGRRAPGITHHVFGRLSPAEALRFATVHNQHHTRQITGR